MQYLMPFFLLSLFPMMALAFSSSTVNFTGVADSPSAYQGTVIRGNFTFDNTVADSRANSRVGEYTDAVTDLHFILNGDEYTFDNTLGTSSILVRNDVGNPMFDQFRLEVTGGLTGPAWNGRSITSFLFILQDSDFQMFSDDSLPLYPPNVSLLDDFPTSRIRVRFEDATSARNVTGQITALIPLPSSLLLMGLGLAGLVPLCRARRKPVMTEVSHLADG